MSFSDEIDDENKDTILPDFDDGTQICDTEKLRQQIAAIKDEEQRQICQARFSSAEEHIELSNRQYGLEESWYIDKHLKLEPSLDLTPLPDERTYDERVQQLKHGFAQTERAIDLRESAEARTEQLWSNLQIFVETFTLEGTRTSPGVDRDQDKSQDRLSQTFHNMTRH
ncbi:hypothetical protein ACOTTU_16990 [Roseobacter sp. EG26]|uniref:hypothetical protein n=1 Tax=Roseobacter sp. EG26 TaxID=3412477 RepID=UPI003CE58956